MSEKTHKKIAFVGCGSVGSIAAMRFANHANNYRILLIDGDFVEERNIGRGAYIKNDVGKAKVYALKEKIKNNNVDMLVDDIKQDNIEMLSDYDLIIDCTDNFLARHIINEFCVKHNKRWIFSAVGREHGLVALFDNDICFNCVFEGKQEMECSMSDVPGQLIKRVADKVVDVALDTLENNRDTGRFIYIIRQKSTESMRLKKNESCRVCAKHDLLHLAKKDMLSMAITPLCGEHGWQIIGREMKNMKNVIKKIEKEWEIEHYSNIFLRAKYKGVVIIILKSGRVIVRNASREEAISIYNDILSSSQ